MKNPPKKNEKPSHKRKSKLPRLFLLASLVIVSSFALFSTFSHNGILDLLKLKTLQQKLQNENTELLQEQENLKAEIFRLKDPHYIEYLARDRLGLMRPNEVFVILDSPQPHSPVDNEHPLKLPEATIHQP